MSSKEPPADEGETSASTHPFRVEGVRECDRVQAGSEDSCAAQVETMAGTMDKRCQAAWEPWICRGLARRWNAGSRGRGLNAHPGDWMSSFKDC